MVGLHLKKHGGDAGKSLAAISIGCSTQESLARIGDPEVEATLARVGTEATPLDDDRTATYAVGSATSDGRRFRVLRPHAMGGLGAVFIALDSELKREVALKQILDDQADDPVNRQRFLLEAEVTGGLEHPGIVPVYGLGTYDDGRPYYAMRFIKGDSLKEAIQHFHANQSLNNRPGGRSLALRKLMRRFIDVCDAIDYAHSRGVLHRDLKPSNVIVGKHGETLVVDWGLAKALGRVEPGLESDEGPLVPSSSTASSGTLPGSAFGTPAYMSPEQAEGRVDQLGPASDVYSLGAMLYYPADRPSPVRLRLVRRDGAARRGSGRGISRRRDRLNPRVHPRAGSGLPQGDGQCGPKTDTARPPALAEEIDRWLADDPVAAYREPAPARLARWGRRHKPIVAGAAALLITAVVALSAGVILVGREQHRTELQRQLAEEQRILAMTKSYEATQKAEALRRRDAVSRVNLAYREYLDDNVALADELLEGYPADLRAWEWSYAHRLGHSDLKTWVASSLGLDVWSVAFSPDGTQGRRRDRPMGPARWGSNRRAGGPRHPYGRRRPSRRAGWPARSRPWPTPRTAARSRRPTDSPARRKAPS